MNYGSSRLFYTGSGGFNYVLMLPLLILIVVVLEFAVFIEVIVAKAVTAARAIAVSEIVIVALVAALTTLIALEVAVVVVIVIVSLLEVAVVAIVVIACGVSVEGDAVATRFVLQLATCDFGQLILDHIIVYGLFVPVAVGQLHIVSDSLRKSVSLFVIWFIHRLI